MDISEVALGVVTSFVYIGYISAAPVSAGICRSMGSMRTVMVGSLFFCLNFAIVGIAGTTDGSNTYWLGFAFYCFGFAMGIMDIAGNSQGILVEVLGNTSYFGLFHGTYAGAVAIGTILGGVFLYVLGDDGSVYICSITGIVLASLAFPISHHRLYDHNMEKKIEKSKSAATASSSSSSSSSLPSPSPSPSSTETDLSTSLLKKGTYFSENVDVKVDHNRDTDDDVNGNEVHLSEYQSKEPLIQCMYPTGVLRLSCITGFLGSFAEGGFLGEYAYMHTYIYTPYILII